MIRDWQISWRGTRRSPRRLANVPAVRLALAPRIRSSTTDTAIALAWIPFAAVAFWLRGDGHQLVWFLEALAAFSLVHQPLTLMLVYGDAEQFAMRRRLFVAGPIVLAVAIAIGMTISFTLVAVVGALWNMEHTLMQRYGFVRIYGRRTGEDDGSLERTLFLSWLIVTLLSVAADARTPERIASLPVGQINGSALDVLTSFRPYAMILLIPSAIVAAVFTVRWLTVERTRGRVGTANRAKQRYVVSTALMFAFAVLVDPVAGLAAYGGAHAVEYLFIVDKRVASSRPTLPRAPIFLGYLTVFALLYSLAVRSDDVYLLVVLYIGGLHFLFDSFIWKGRTKSLAQPIAANASA